MRRILLFVLLTCMFCGCASNTEINSGGDDMSVEENKRMEPNNTDATEQIVKFLELMKSDKVGDETAVIWENESAFPIEDRLDSSEINDGYVGVTEATIYRADLCIACEYPSEFVPDDVDENVPDKLHLVNEKDKEEIFIERINYSETVKAFDNNPNYVEIDGTQLSEHQTKYFKSYKLYSGIKEMNAEKKAGFVLVFDSELDERAYMIEVYGQGNMNLLRIKAFFVMNNFEVLFY